MPCPVSASNSEMVLSYIFHVRLCFYVKFQDGLKLHFSCQIVFLRFSEFSEHSGDRRQPEKDVMMNVEGIF
jgi:hypothetical protein